MSEQATPSIIVPTSDESVTSDDTTFIEPNDCRFLALSLERNLNSPAVSPTTPTLSPLALESFIIAPTESFVLLRILTDGSIL